MADISEEAVNEVARNLFDGGDIDYTIERDGSANIDTWNLPDVDSYEYSYGIVDKETLDKYQIGYLWDPGTQLQTLKKLTQLKAALFVPSHAAPCEDIAPLAQYNIQKIQQVTHDILSICTEPAGFDRILQKLFIRYNLHMTAKQHAVIGSTVRSYLSWLKKSGRLTLTFENNIMQWQTIQE